jgi:predicted transcriptional regulator
MAKDTNKKSRCTKKYLLTAQGVADMIGCSTSYVKKLRAGIVDTKSPLARRVLAVDLLAEDGSNMLLKEIERIVKLPA